MKVTVVLCLVIISLQNSIGIHLGDPRYGQSSISTEYEARFSQTRSNGSNAGEGSIAGSHTVQKATDQEPWETFAEKCADMIRGLVDALTSALSSSPGDATDLELEIKNRIFHHDNRDFNTSKPASFLTGDHDNNNISGSSSDASCFPHCESETVDNNLKDSDDSAQSDWQPTPEPTMNTPATHEIFYGTTTPIPPVHYHHPSMTSSLDDNVGGDQVPVYQSPDSATYCNDLCEESNDNNSPYGQNLPIDNWKPVSNYQPDLLPQGSPAISDETTPPNFSFMTPVTSETDTIPTSDTSKSYPDYLAPESPVINEPYGTPIHDDLPFPMHPVNSANQLADRNPYDYETPDNHHHNTYDYDFENSSPSAILPETHESSSYDTPILDAVPHSDYLPNDHYNHHNQEPNNDYYASIPETEKNFESIPHHSDSASPNHHYPYHHSPSHEIYEGSAPNTPILESASHHSDSSPIDNHHPYYHEPVQDDYFASTPKTANLEPICSPDYHHDPYGHHHSCNHESSSHHTPDFDITPQKKPVFHHSDSALPGHHYPYQQNPTESTYDNLPSNIPPYDHSSSSPMGHQHPNCHETGSDDYCISGPDTITQNPVCHHPHSFPSGHDHDNHHDPQGHCHYDSSADSHGNFNFDITTETPVCHHHDECHSIPEMATQEPICHHPDSFQPGHHHHNQEPCSKDLPSETFDQNSPPQVIFHPVTDHGRPIDSNVHYPPVGHEAIPNHHCYESSTCHPVFHNSPSLPSPNHAAPEYGIEPIPHGTSHFPETGIMDGKHIQQHGNLPSENKHGHSGGVIPTGSSQQDSGSSSSYLPSSAILIPIGEGHSLPDSSDEDEDSCSCDDCYDADACIADPKVFCQTACRDLEEARNELKAIFDKIKKKLKCTKRF